PIMLDLLPRLPAASRACCRWPTAFRESPDLGTRSHGRLPTRLYREERPAKHPGSPLLRPFAPVSAALRFLMALALLSGLVPSVDGGVTSCATRCTADAYIGGRCSWTGDQVPSHRPGAGVPGRGRRDQSSPSWG